MTGAVIVRGSRVAAAGCVMPLTENTHLPSDIGTRHRAGIGSSEVSDAVVVIVSEETGYDFGRHRRHAQAAPGAEDA